MSYNKKKLILGDKVSTYYLENDFKICKSVNHLPIAPYPSYVQYGMIIYCLKGTADVDIHGNKHQFTAGELIVILPGQLVSTTNLSPDFTVSYFILTHTLYNDILCGICRFSPHFFFYMRNHFHYKLTDTENENFTSYFRMIEKRMHSSRYFYKRESIIHLLRTFYLDLYNTYKNCAWNINSIQDTHRRGLADKFFTLIMEHYKENRDVAFYANKLCITPKYLSAVIKKTSNKSAKDWILEYVILEIKGLLRHSNLNFQEIAIKTNFSNQSSLGRFFRKHTGVSLSEYRTGKQTISNNKNLKS